MITEPTSLDHCPGKIVSHPGPLKEHWTFPPCTLPEPIKQCVEALDVQSGTFSDALVMPRLAGLFQRHGLPVRGVVRMVRCVCPGIDGGKVDYALAGLEMEGMVHGLRGGMGWQDLFEIQRYHRETMKKALLSDPQLECRWGEVEEDSPSINPADPWGTVIAPIIAQWKAQVLEGTTPTRAATGPKGRL